MSPIKSIFCFFLSIFLILSMSCSKEGARSSSSTDEGKASPETDTKDCTSLNLLENEVNTEDEDIDVVEGEEPDVEEGDTPTEGGEKPGAQEDDGIGGSSDCGDPSPGGGTPAGGGTNNGTSWNPGPGIEGCKELGKVWIAVSNGGPGVCGEALVDWCCSETNIKAKYPGLAGKLDEAFAAKKTSGLTLYGCENTGGGTSVHYFSNSSGRPSWAKTTIPGSAFNSPEPATCKEVTSEDLGVTLGAAEEDPKAPEVLSGKLGAIDDITPAGVLKFLKVDKGHEAFPDEPSLDGTGDAHGGFAKYKIYFNQVMKDSINANDEEQPKGSIVVRELYEGTELKGYAVRLKIKEGDDESTWGYYQIVSDDAGEFPDKPGTYATGEDDAAGACIACHATGKDFTRSTLP